MRHDQHRVRELHELEGDLVDGLAAVDDDVVELLAHHAQQPLHGVRGGGVEAVELGRGGQHVDTRGVPREHAHQVGGVEAGDVLGHLPPVERRVDVEKERDLAEEQVHVDHRHGVLLADGAQAGGEVHGDRGRPDAALAADQIDHLAVAAAGGALRGVALERGAHLAPP